MKKIKQLLVFAMIAACTLFLFSVSALAVDTSFGESNAEVQFIEGSGAPAVLDPVDPSDPFDREDPLNPDDPPTGETGPLTLDYVSSILFGQHEIESNTAVYQSTTVRPFIQVTDRRGSGDGWRVTASVSTFTDEEDNESLTGSVITLSNGTVISTSTSDEPIPAEEISLTAGGDASLIVNAPIDTGLGTWITRWLANEEETLNNNVTLTVPAGSATLGSHTATISWVLADAPGQ